MTKLTPISQNPSYTELNTYLGGKTDRPIKKADKGHWKNTRIVRVADNVIGIKYHSTIIVYHTPHYVLFDSGGYFAHISEVPHEETSDNYYWGQSRRGNSTSTPERMTYFSPCSASYSARMPYMNGRPYEDGMIFTRTGNYLERIAYPEKYVHYLNEHEKSLAIFVQDLSYRVYAYTAGFEPNEIFETDDVFEAHKAMHRLLSNDWRTSWYVSGERLNPAQYDSYKAFPVGEVWKLIPDQEIEYELGDDSSVGNVIYVIECVKKGSK